MLIVRLCALKEHELNAREDVLKSILPQHLKAVNKLKTMVIKHPMICTGVTQSEHTCFFLVGTNIFSNTVKDCVDITYLKYFKDLKLIGSYVWSPAALAFLYWELPNVIIPLCKYLAGYLTLLQVTFYRCGTRCLAQHVQLYNTSKIINN
jgi:hypothetical protein